MKTPPNDFQAEAAALGSVLHDSRTLDTLRAALASPEDFYVHKHATIYQAMLSVAEGGAVWDTVKLTGRLMDMGVLEQVGGVPYLIELINSVTSHISIDYFAARVAERALRRRLIETQELSIRALYDGDTPAKNLIDSTVNRLIEMSPPEGVREGHLQHWLTESLRDDKPRVQTGLFALDQIIEGFEPGAMVIVGARPSQGKSAFGVTVALDMAHRRLPLGFVSAEMKARKIGRRIVCAELQISTTDYDEIKHGKQVQDAITSLGELPIWIDETPGMHIDQVCMRIRRWHREHGIKVAIVDYLQLLGTSRETEYEAVTEASRALKGLAGELDIVMVVLAQLNRGNTQRTDKRPTMADLRGSGAIEQDADIILLLHRESYYRKESDALNPLETLNDNEAEIIVEKNRDGATGTAHVGWIGRCGVFASGVSSAF